MARKIEVEIVGDASSFERSLNKAGGASNRFGGVLKGAAIGLGALGVGAAVAGAKVIGMASDAAEVDSKLNVVFGRHLPGVSKEIANFSKQTGVSRFEMRQQAADMGALLGPMLGSKKGAAEMSVQFSELAADLGSFNNVPTADALLAIRSGLVGEAEPLRRFGVLINAAAVEQEAYRLGLAKTGAELTESQKVQARASLIMKQTTQAQGDATRTAGSMANQMKALKNTLTDTATEAGMVLLPAALSLVTVIREDVIPVLSGWFDELKTKVGPVINDVGRISHDVFPEIRRVVVDAFTQARTIAQAVWPGISKILGAVADVIRNNVVPIVRRLAEVAIATWGAIARVLKEHEPEITRITRAVATLMRGIGVTIEWLANKIIIPILKPVFTTVLPVALGLTIDAIDILVRSITGMKNGFVWIKENAASAFGTFWARVQKGLGFAKSAFGAFADVVDKIISGFRWLSDNAGKVGGFFSGLASKVASGAKSVGDVSAGFNSAIAAAQRPVYAGGGGVGSGGLAPQTAGLLGQLNQLFDQFIMTSGYRSPAENAAVGGATNSDHMTGRAFDLVPSHGWSASSIAHFDRIAAYAATLPLVRWIGWRGVPGHGPYDHLHISTYDQGGLLMPGLTLAANYTGRPERVVGPGDEGPQRPLEIVLQLGDRELARALYDPLKAEITQQTRAGNGLPVSRSAAVL